METLSAHSVDPAELERLDSVVASLPSDSSLGAALQYVSASVRSGVGVTLAQADDQISPAAAAKLLGMSRTHLYKLLDANLIPSVNVGRDRRLASADVAAYARSQWGDRASLAQRFAHSGEDRDNLLDRLSQDTASIL